MYLVINKFVTAVKVSNFSCHYLRNRSTLDTGVSGYIGIVQHKEHSPEVLSIPPGTPCVCTSVTVRNYWFPWDSSKVSELNYEPRRCKVYRTTNEVLSPSSSSDMSHVINGNAVVRATLLTNVCKVSVTSQVRRKLV